MLQFPAMRIIPLVTQDFIEKRIPISQKASIYH